MKSVDWHPTKSLLVSGVYYGSVVNFVQIFVLVALSKNIYHCLIGCYVGGKDNLVKLWDAKTGRELSSLLVLYFHCKTLSLVY